MTDILGTVLIWLIIIGAIGFALIKIYQWLKKEKLIGGTKMGFMDAAQPKWEVYKDVAVYENMPGLAEWQRKIDEGWELVACKENKFFFRKVN